jgi:hypothetical protein
LSLGRGFARPHRAGERADKGQVLVLFALAIIILFVSAGLAIDVGRFYSERRFLQNAADAAALAAANALIRGETVANADLEARAILTRNFAGAPNGLTPALPPTTPVYESGHAGDPEYLLNGILISGGSVRVAVQNPIPYTFGRVIGLDTNPIGGRARTQAIGDLLPIAVRQFVHAPGPSSYSTCSGDETQFMDFFASSSTSCLGTETNTSLRAEASPSNPGPTIAILGQGAQPSNGADFRGFIALDIRNFAAAGTQLYYNEVTPATGQNTLKAMEANWIYAGGYPGPLFPPVVNPPDSNDQVGIMNGNSTGAAIDAMIDRFVPGDTILVSVYPGNVMQIPDFTITPPATIALPSTGLVLNAGSMKVSRNNDFSGQVTLTTLADNGDPNNPMVTGTLLGGATPITYSPNGVTPSQGSGTTVTLSNVATLGAADGIYTLWIMGQAGSPYLTTKYEPMSINVGNVSRDFTITSDATVTEVASAGGTATFVLNLKRIGAAFGGSGVTLSLDGPLPTGIGAVSFSPSNVAPAASTGTDSTLTINTGTMAPGRHRFVVRATGTNGDSTPHPVTHLLQLYVDVATGGGGNDDYVDISGFAVMRVASLNSNTISAYAITPVIADITDERLLLGQEARLVPWN